MAKEYLHEIPEFVESDVAEVEAVVAAYAIAERLEALVEVMDKVREAIIYLQRG